VSVRLTRRPLSMAAAARELEGPGLGGIVIFAGRVRPDRTREGRVTRLDYEAHRPIATAALAKLESTARRRFGAERVVLWHRLGPIPVDEVSVIAGAATGHRAAAFAAARYLIEQLKATVPIWKVARSRPERPPRRLPGGRAAR